MNLKYSQFKKNVPYVPMFSEKVHEMKTIIHKQKENETRKHQKKQQKNIRKVPGEKKKVQGMLQKQPSQNRWGGNGNWSTHIPGYLFFPLFGSNYLTVTPQGGNCKGHFRGLGACQVVRPDAAECHPLAYPWDFVFFFLHMFFNYYFLVFSAFWFLLGFPQVLVQVLFFPGTNIFLRKTQHVLLQEAQLYFPKKKKKKHSWEKHNISSMGSTAHVYFYRASQKRKVLMCFHRKSKKYSLCFCKKHIYASARAHVVLSSKKGKAQRVLLRETQLCFHEKHKPRKKRKAQFSLPKKMKNTIVLLGFNFFLLVFIFLGFHFFSGFSFFGSIFS